MTELEMIMLDWFGKMIGLPKEFLPFNEHGRGGGVIQVGISVFSSGEKSWFRARQASVTLWLCLQRGSKSRNNFVNVFLSSRKVYSCRN